MWNILVLVVVIGMASVVAFYLIHARRVKMNSEDPNAVARHEAGHAVIAHAFGWNVTACHIRPKPYTQVELPDDFRDCDPMWNFIDAGPETVQELASQARDAVSANTQRPLILGMLYLMAGELLEHSDHQEVVVVLCDPRRFASKPHADANKLRVLDNAWKTVAQTEGSLRDSLLGDSQNLRRLADPIVQRVCQRLLSEGAITRSSLIDVFSQSDAEVQAFLRALESMVDSRVARIQRG